MSQTIEFKRVKGVKLKFEGEEYNLSVPSLEQLMPMLDTENQDLSFQDSIAQQRKVFDMCGLPSEIYMDLSPVEHAQMWDIILGQVKKK